jgi:hypothetical protein
MRRAEREITDPRELDDILAEARVLYLGLRDEPAPYVLPVCFGHEQGTLYVHSAPAGAKIDLILADPAVGFSASTEMTVQPAPTPCGFTSRARSVVGTGRARIVEDDAERKRGLDAIMRHYADSASAHRYAPGPLSRTCVIAIRVESICGKRTG